MIRGIKSEKLRRYVNEYQETWYIYRKIQQVNLAHMQNERNLT